MILGQATLLLLTLVLVHLTEGQPEEDKVQLARQKRQVELDVELLGCYKLFKTPPKKRPAFGKVFYKRRFKNAQFPEDDPNSLVQICAEKAHKRKFVLMGVTKATYRRRFTVLVCRTALKSPDKRYKQYGLSAECKNGIGGSDSMVVYRVKEKNSGIDIKGSCKFNGNTYSEGDEMKVPNEYGDVGDAQCQQCRCSRGRPVSCRTEYYCETGSLVACEKISVAPGDCCPSCECVHQGKPVDQGEHWVNLKKGPGGHECTVFTCGGRGRAEPLQGNTFCDCPGFHKMPANNQAKQPCCKAICKNYKPKTTASPDLVTTEDNAAQYTFPPF